MKRYLSSITAALLLALTFGCTPGCGTLAPSGVYQGDKVLYDADFAIATSYDFLHSFVSWEFQNRAALAGTPEIKQYADKVRAGAKTWITSAISLRDAYAANPTSENRTNLQKAIAVLREAILQAAKYQASTTLAETPH